MKEEIYEGILIKLSTQYKKKVIKNVAYFCPTVSLEPWANNL